MGILNKESLDDAFGKIKKATSDFISTVSEDNSAKNKKYSCFCTNCGAGLAANEKFCHNCGTAVAGNIKAETEQPPATPKESEPETVKHNETERKQEYAGKILKCPNCGAVINSFIANCPACGHELRGIQATSAVHELATKIEAIESERKSRYRGLFIKKITQVDEKKISLIRNFSIPNTREDLYEFLILSKSNIDVELYENDSPIMKGDARVAISDAWRAKFEQAYQKAKLVFIDDSKMIEIQEMYDDLHKSIKKAKTKKWRMIGISFGILFVFLIIEFTLIGGLQSSSEKDTEKEVARLNGIVDEIENALEDNDYRLALMYADGLRFRENDSDLEEDWEIKRDYWLDKIIEEAAKDGVILKKPIDKKDESESSVNENNTNKESVKDSFTEGFNDAMDESKKKVQKNVDEFYENLNGGETSSTSE